MDNIPDGIDVDGSSKQRDGSNTLKMRSEKTSPSRMSGWILVLSTLRLAGNKLVSLHIRRGNPIFRVREERSGLINYVSTHPSSDETRRI